MLLVMEGTVFGDYNPEAIAKESKVLEWAIAQVGNRAWFKTRRFWVTKQAKASYRK